MRPAPRSRLLKTQPAEVGVAEKLLQGGGFAEEVAGDARHPGGSELHGGEPIGLLAAVGERGVGGVKLGDVREEGEGFVAVVGNQDALVPEIGVGRAGRDVAGFGAGQLPRQCGHHVTAFDVGVDLVLGWGGGSGQNQQQARTEGCGW